jgi:hypothetical protein
MACLQRAGHAVDAIGALWRRSASLKVVCTRR